MGHFDKYKTHPDPKVRQRAANWGIAVGLQAVDNLKVSGYLIMLAELNIEGKITVEQLDALIKRHYMEKDNPSNPCPSVRSILEDKTLQ